MSENQDLPENRRLTPDEYKREYRSKGWTGRTLAARWKVSHEWVSRTGNDPDRAPHWDDAVRGLPHIGKAGSRQKKDRSQ